MVKIVREIFLTGEVSHVFDTIMNDLPKMMMSDNENDTYTILEEIAEHSRIYRKVLIHRNDTLDMIPSVIKERLPDTLIHTATRLIQESIYYPKDQKIQWSITNECDPIYTISGTTRFLDMSDNLTKIIILVHFRLEDLSRYIQNSTTRDLVRPFLESKIPELCIDNIRDIYSRLVNP